MAQTNTKITSIEIDGKKFNMIDSRVDKISERLDHLDGDYYTSLEDAFRRVRKSIKELGLRLCGVESDLYSYLNQVVGASAGENAESQEKILSGEFWDEIEKNNMFLKNLK